MAAGDIDGDRIPDSAVAVLDEDNVDDDRGGAVNVIYGSDDEGLVSSCNQIVYLEESNVTVQTSDKHTIFLGIWRKLFSGLSSDDLHNWAARWSR